MPFVSPCSVLRGVSVALSLIVVSPRSGVRGSRVDPPWSRAGGWLAGCDGKTNERQKSSQSRWQKVCAFGNPEERVGIVGEVGY